MTRFSPAPKPTPKKRQPKPSKARSRVKRVNPERKTAAFAVDYAGPFADWIRRKQCAVSGRTHHYGLIQAAHVRGRGAGGEGVANLLPLCGMCHAAQHSGGWAAIEHDLDEERHILAARYWLRYIEEGHS